MTAPLPASPIGIYDSGVGGLSVLRAIREALPSESLLYVADSAHVPYGEKSQAFVEQRALTVADYFVSRQAKAMVVACNTATAAAIAQVRQRHPNLIVIGVEPAIKPAAHLTHSGVVGVFATTGTLASPKFATLVQREAPEVRILLRPCPEWVRLVEAGELTGPTVQAAVAAPVEELRAAGADVLVLGCTHFPFLRDAIQAAAGPGVPLLETGAPVARWLRHQLQERALLRPVRPDGDAPAEPNANAPAGTDIGAAAVPPPDPGLLRLETTGNAPALAALASRLLSLRVDAFVTPERWR